MAARRMMSASGEDDAPPSPPPADTVARSEARGGPDLGDVARGAAAQTMQGEESGPGMSATPRRPDTNGEPEGEA
jgi:hypothetical protein